MPAKPKNPRDAVEQLRDRIATLKAERKALGNAPVAHAEAEAAIDAYIANTAERYARARPIQDLVHRGTLDGLNVVDDTEAFAAFVLGDQIKTALMAEIEPALATGMDAQTRASELAKNTAALRKAEREEESLIQQAESEGLPITRRADADPRIVLGLDDTEK